MSTLTLSSIAVASCLGRSHKHLVYFEQRRQMFAATPLCTVLLFESPQYGPVCYRCDLRGHGWVDKNRAIKYCRYINLCGLVIKHQSGSGRPNIGRTSVNIEQVNELICSQKVRLASQHLSDCS